MNLQCSVALATFNGERFIRQQLYSIVNQSHKVDEIIISDDLSNDNTIEIVKSFTEEYPEISWKIILGDSNKGYRENFRKAASFCTKDIVFFCDQDDIWYPTKVQTMMEIFEKKPEVLTIISDFKTIGQDGVLLQPEEMGESLFITNRLWNNKNILEKIKLYEAVSHVQGMGCATATRYEIVQMYLKCNLNWSHDHLIDVISAMHSGFYFYAQPLLYYRQHGHNTIGMPVGGPNLRKISFLKKIYIFFTVIKHCFIKKSSCDCKKRLFYLETDSLEYISKEVGCIYEEYLELVKVLQFESNRKSIIENNKLLEYIKLRIKYPYYFKEEMPLCTYESYVVRLVEDLCVILKK